MKKVLFTALAASLLTTFIATTANARLFCAKVSANSGLQYNANTKRIAKTRAISNWNRRAQNAYIATPSDNWNNARFRSIKYLSRNGGYRAIVTARICHNRPSRCAPRDMRCHADAKKLRKK